MRRVAASTSSGRTRALLLSRPLFWNNGSGRAVVVAGAPSPFAAAAAANAAHSRGAVAAASSRLVLTPTGSGSCEHIGAKVPLPPPIPLKDGVYEVGRAPPADIALPIPTVSTRHALLRVDGATVYVTDLNSTNGTMVNGAELSPMDNVAVEVGSEVVFGDLYLARFQLDWAPAEGVGAPGGGAAAAAAAAGGSGGGSAASGSAGGLADSGTVAMGGGGADSGGYYDAAGRQQTQTVRSSDRAQRQAKKKQPWSPY